MSEELYKVKNILADDDSIDPLWGNKRSDYFEVRYDGEAVRIAPGETVVLPKHLAEHFAKHLVDYLLARQKKMMHDELLRQPLLNKILTKVDEQPSEPNRQGSGNRAEGERPIIEAPRPQEPRTEDTGTTGEKPAPAPEKPAVVGQARPVSNPVRPTANPLRQEGEGIKPEGNKAV